jgi:hypothetical protein
MMSALEHPVFTVWYLKDKGLFHEVDAALVMA